MEREYLDLYDQDIGDGSGGDATSIAAVGNINIAGAAPNYKPAPYRSKVRKGGKKAQRATPPAKASRVARPDEWEYNNPAG